jgi:hypothetical protein
MMVRLLHIHQPTVAVLKSRPSMHQRNTCMQKLISPQCASLVS